MRFELRLHGRRVAAAEVPEMVPFAMARRAAKRAYESGQDVAFHDVGKMLLELRAAGRDDNEIIVGVEDLIMLRMMAGLPDAAAQLTEGES